MNTPEPHVKSFTRTNATDTIDTIDAIDAKWTEVHACVEQIRQRTNEAKRLLKLILLESDEN